VGIPLWLKINNSGERNPMAKKMKSKSIEIPPKAPDSLFLTLEKLKIMKGTKKWVKKSIKILFIQ
jgi:hypothetical protein